MNKQVQAYFYESRIVSGKGSGGSWSNQLRDSHPESISNIEYRNLQRLVLADDVDEELQPLGFKYELHSGTDVSEHIVRPDIRTVDRSDVKNIQPLVPHPEDVGAGPELEPLREKGFAEYYSGIDGEEQTVYYRVSIDDDCVEVFQDGVVKAGRMYDVWQFDKAGQLERVSYEETPFSDPKY